MNFFSGSNTCFQCQKPFAHKHLYCPHCGASRREDGGQVFVRRMRRGAVSLILGGMLGVAAALLLGTLFPNWLAGLARFPFLSGTFAVQLVGMTLGGMVGVFLYALKEYARE